MISLADLKQMLTEGNVEAVDPFNLLREISVYVNDMDTEDIGRELVLRTLDKRELFADYEEILDSLTRQVGLFPYLEEEKLSFKDVLAYDLHRPPGEREFVFHQAQAEIYRKLMDGNNMIVSAPTSFGKSRIIDAVIAANRHNNIVLIVPTIALIDETRRRLSVFREDYKIITQVSQEADERNVFIFTAERVIAYPNLPKIDFFVIDEFYKIGEKSGDNSRVSALNQAFYSLQKGGGQFYMLGPSIRQIPDGIEERFACHFLSTSFSTVVSELVLVPESSNEMESLISLLEEMDDQALIYCRSPKRVNDVVATMIDSEVCEGVEDLSYASDWVANNFHAEWVFRKALDAGIGMHHGRLPRSLSQYSVRAFNEGKTKFLVCTSTLIEGVNTRAKNVVILDKTIGNKNYDYFTFNNIKGRSGRMFHHYIGKVYVFHEPPQEELPFVDFPFFTQPNDAPESLLIQLDDVDLQPASRERLAGINEQSILPIDVIKANKGIEPSAQVSLAEALMSMPEGEARSLCWSGVPSFDDMLPAFDLLWRHFWGNRGHSGVFSARQLAFKTTQLMQYFRNVQHRIGQEIDDGRDQGGSATDAVERVLEFDRNWANFHMPKALRAMSSIQKIVLERRLGTSGDYSFFAGRLESLFRNPVAMAFEEYGLPIQIMDKIERSGINLSDELDAAINMVSRVRPQDVGLDEFETELFLDALSHL